MTHEIIEMAREAGYLDLSPINRGMELKELEAFAKLVADKALAQRTWVGLSDEEFDELDKEDLSLREFVQAIDDRLKQKNGYADSD